MTTYDDDDLMFSFEMEVDKRRSGKKSEYLDGLEAQMDARERENAKKSATFILSEKHQIGEIVWSGILQYRVVEVKNYISPKEANAIADLDPNIESGWVTRVELVA